MDLQFRAQPRERDIGEIETLLRSTGFFSQEELLVARELIQEYLDKGPGSGYRFLFADGPTFVAGYTCYGPIPCTLNSWNLYWIGVRADLRGGGIGSVLLEKTESLIREAGGKRVYIETSSRELYRPTRDFYHGRGYDLEARLKAFYGPGDDKCIFSRTL